MKIMRRDTGLSQQQQQHRLDMIDVSDMIDLHTSVLVRWWCIRPQSDRFVSVSFACTWTHWSWEAAYVSLC